MVVEENYNFTIIIECSRTPIPAVRVCVCSFVSVLVVGMENADDTRRRFAHTILGMHAYVWGEWGTQWQLLYPPGTIRPLCGGSLFISK